MADFELSKYQKNASACFMGMHMRPKSGKTTPKAGFLQLLG